MKFLSIFQVSRGNNLGKIKIRILGSAPGMPTVDKHQAAVWMSVNNRNILFDCGDGTASQLLRYNLGKDVLDAIAISHFHPDHISGIYLVLQMLYLQSREKTLNIFLPERIQDFQKTMEMFYLFPERLSFNINFKRMDDLSNDYEFIFPIPNKHLNSHDDFITEHDLDNKSKCFTFLVDSGSKKIFYTSDIKSIDIEAYQEANLIILDAFHPPAEKILELIKRTKARVILNHGLSEKMKKLINENEYEIADEQKEIII